MKTPISYYGGQQSILKHILPLLPKHKIYNEPFAGGAALLFAKEPAEFNVINDLNGELINFYRTAVSDFTALKKEIQRTLHSREQISVAKFIYKYPDYFSNIQRAWAVWALSRLCFASDFSASLSICKTGKNRIAKRVGNGKLNFVNEIKDILERCFIENKDALEVIGKYDTPETFHFLAPPYVGTNMGHYYDMFNEDSLCRLLQIMSELSGKFMLVMFPNDHIKRFADKYKWNIIVNERIITANHKKRRKQEEWIILNYKLDEK